LIINVNQQNQIVQKLEKKNVNQKIDSVDGQDLEKVNASKQDVALQFQNVLEKNAKNNLQIVHGKVH